MNKSILFNKRGQLYTYNETDMLKVLDTYAKEVLIFNNLFGLSEEGWEDLFKNTLASMTFLDEKIMIINKLCKVNSYKIAKIITGEIDNVFPNIEPDTDSTDGTDGIEYRIFDNNKAEVIGYVGTKSDITIAYSFNGYPVVQIAEGAFKNNLKLTSITFPLVRKFTIGAEAFKNCSNLKTIHNIKQIKDIGPFAFESCNSLTEINLSANLSEGAFKNCTKLRKVTQISGTLGPSVFSGCLNLFQARLNSTSTTLQDDVFKDCASLISIILPKTIDYISETAFSGCESLNELFYDGDEEDWASLISTMHEESESRINLSNISIKHFNTIFIT